MTRQSRMLLVAGIMLVIFVAALGGLIGRYRRMIAPKETGATATTAPLGSTAPAGEGGTTGETQAPPPPTVEPVGSDPARRVDAFIVTRQALKKFMDDHPREMQFLTTGDRDRKQFWPKSMAYMGFLTALRVARDSAANGVGFPVESYREVRAAYRDWKEGRAAGDADLRQALEARRKDLEALDLGAYEPADP